MFQNQQLLNLVDENDKIIGQATRNEIHKHGLLHREVHVWVYNDEGGVLLQKRSLTKDTFPGLLDASAGGHVELNQSYKEAAKKELLEETGIKADASDLIFLKKTRGHSYDPKTKTTNNTFRGVFAYRNINRSEELKLEKGKALSLKFWPIEKILNIKEKDKKKFVPAISSGKFTEIFRKIKELMKK